jgi:hypothetical protein
MPYIDPHEEMKKAKKVKEHVNSITSKQKIQGYDEGIPKGKKSKAGCIILFLIIIGIILILLSKNPKAINNLLDAFK